MVIAVRNEEEYLDRCLASVVDQDYPREQLEIILVDGCSNDKTREIISEWRSAIRGFTCWTTRSA